MNRNIAFLIFMGVLAGLNLGSIRKAEDPVRDTQTNPILYEQKKEEEKGGKKGAVLYHVKNSPYETFFIDPPFEKEKKAPSEKIVTEEAPAETSGWWEEQPTTSQSAIPTEMVAESPSESLPQAEKGQGYEAKEQPPAAPDTEKASSGKEDDYWW